jgi:hypothetical protein
MIEMLSLEEQAGWPLSDDPEFVTEHDIDIVAEIEEADMWAEHNRLEGPEFCCGGRNVNCGEHWTGGFGWAA